LTDFPAVQETTDSPAYPASKETPAHRAETAIPARLEEMERTAFPACQASRENREFREFREGKETPDCQGVPERMACQAPQEHAETTERTALERDPKEKLEDLAWMESQAPRVTEDFLVDQDLMVHLAKMAWMGQRARMAKMEKKEMQVNLDHLDYPDKTACLDVAEILD